jgi:hypothetical protein
MTIGAAKTAAYISIAFAKKRLAVSENGKS